MGTPGEGTGQWTERGEDPARSGRDGRGGDGGRVGRALAVRVALVGQRREVALRVERGGTAGAGGGDGLAVLVVDDVSAGEHPGHAGTAGAAVDGHVATVV